MCFLKESYKKMEKNYNFESALCTKSGSMPLKKLTVKGVIHP